MIAMSEVYPKDCESKKLCKEIFKVMEEGEVETSRFESVGCRVSRELAHLRRARPGIKVSPFSIQTARVPSSPTLRLQRELPFSLWPAPLLPSLAFFTALGRDGNKWIASWSEWRISCLRSQCWAHKYSSKYLTLYIARNFVPYRRIGTY